MNETNILKGKFQGIFFLLDVFYYYKFFYTFVLFHTNSVYIMNSEKYTMKTSKTKENLRPLQPVKLYSKHAVYLGPKAQFPREQLDLGSCGGRGGVLISFLNSVKTLD